MAKLSEKLASRLIDTNSAISRPGWFEAFDQNIAKELVSKTEDDIAALTELSADCFDSDPAQRAASCTLKDKSWLSLDLPVPSAKDLEYNQVYGYFFYTPHGVQLANGSSYWGDTISTLDPDGIHKRDRYGANISHLEHDDYNLFSQKYSSALHALHSCTMETASGRRTHFVTFDIGQCNGSGLNHVEQLGYAYKEPMADTRPLYFCVENNLTANRYATPALSQCSGELYKSEMRILAYVPVK